MIDAFAVDGAVFGRQVLVVLATIFLDRIADGFPVDVFVMARHAGRNCAPANRLGLVINRAGFFGKVCCCAHFTVLGGATEISQAIHITFGKPVGKQGRRTRIAKRNN